MKPMRKIIVLGLLCGCGAGVYGILSCTQNREAEIERLQEQAAAIRQTVTPVKFRITETDDTATQVEIHFYDVAGQDIAQVTESVPGREPTFGFAIDPIGANQNLAFPIRLYSEKLAPAQGIALSERYVGEDGFPRIFDQSPYASEASARSKVIERFAEFRKGALSGAAFGNDLYAPAFHGFKTGKVYAIQFHPYTGTPTIRESE